MIDNYDGDKQRNNIMLLVVWYLGYWGMTKEWVSRVLDLKVDKCTPALHLEAT